MKLLWHVFVGLILIHLLAAAGFVGWMYSDGRINQERIDKVVDTFRLTIDEEAEQEAQNEQLELENRKREEQVAWLEDTGDGPTTTRDRVTENRQIDEITLSRLQLVNDQNRALREEMARFKEDYDRRIAELSAERAAFEQWVEDRAAQTQDANFQQVVSLYQIQPPKQTKQAFQALMQQGETDQVVEYLAAMSSRSAGQVLAQFKTPAEVAQAAELLEKLRTRGEYTMDDQAASTGNPS